MSQAELRIAAALSSDPEMRRCFTTGVDIHWKTLMDTLQTGGSEEYISMLMSTAWKHTGRRPKNVRVAAQTMLEAGHAVAIEINSLWKEGRKRAKAINFGFLYGMYEKKFIETAKQKYDWTPTFNEARQARGTYFDSYGGIPTWHEHQKRMVRMDGFVRSLSGRMRRLPGIYSKDRTVRSECERQAINSPVQGFIGDYKAMAMVELHERLDPKKAKIVGEHHDAILFIIREDSINEVAPIILEVLRHPRLLDTFKINLNIPMEGELEIGRWGKGKTYHFKVDTA
jgi:DNA polymerase I-like protein with 3'-5' exonuclease and polymerase domains